MDVKRYLNRNVHKFNVDLLEKMFDLENMGDMLDVKQTSEFFKSINTTVVKQKRKKTPIKQDKAVRAQMNLFYFVDVDTQNIRNDANEIDNGVGCTMNDSKKKTVKGQRRKNEANSPPSVRPKKTSQATKKLQKQLNDMTVSAAQITQY